MKVIKSGTLYSVLGRDQFNLVLKLLRQHGVPYLVQIEFTKRGYDDYGKRYAR